MAQLYSNENVALVQNVVGHFLAGDADGYLSGVHPNVKGSVLGGLIPGADTITNKAQLAKLLKEDIPKYMDIRKFEPANWVGVGDQVFFTVDWEFVWKPTGKVVTTRATVRKVVCDGLICEKYHMPVGILRRNTFFRSERAALPLTVAAAPESHSC